MRRAQREAAEQALVQPVDAGGALGDVLAADHQHQHPVHPVLVHALRRRLPSRAGPRLDAELVHLDVPGGHRRQPVEQVVAEADDGRNAAPRLSSSIGVEPARDAAVQRVVVAALVVRLVRLALDPVGRGAEGGVAALPVAAAIGHVGVQPEIVPARANAPSPARPCAPSAARISGASHEHEPGVSQCLFHRQAACSFSRVAAPCRVKRRRVVRQHPVAGERALDRQLVELHLDPPVQLARHRPAAAGSVLMRARITQAVSMNLSTPITSRSSEHQVAPLRVRRISPRPRAAARRSVRLLVQADADVQHRDRSSRASGWSRW